MPAAPKHRDAIVAAAVRLFRRQGYAGTGLAQILAESGAPKGSLYHYFPDGKAQIGAEAVTVAGRTVAATLEELAATTEGPGSLVAAYLERLEGWMRDSGFRDGSPITTTLLETVPGDERIRRACAAALDDWSSVIESSARRAGIGTDDAAPLARAAIAIIEGALIQCRVSGDGVPLRTAADQYQRLVQATRTAPEEEP